METGFDGMQMKLAMELAASPQGQQLLAQLQQSAGKELRLAMEMAAAGDLEAARRALEGISESEEVRKLMQQLGR